MPGRVVAQPLFKISQKSFSQTRNSTKTRIDSTYFNEYFVSDWLGLY